MMIILVMSVLLNQREYLSIYKLGAFLSHTSVQYNDFKGLVIWPNSHFS